MNHNEDIAFKSIKIISHSDSYNKNSGSLIVNGGIGCKNTIHTKNICAEEGCFKKITTDILSLQSFENIDINFEHLSVDNLKVEIAEIQNAEIDILNVTKCIFKDILPKDEMSSIGNEDNKVNIIGNNIKTESLNVDIIKSKNIENSDNIYSANAKLDNIISDNIKSKCNYFNNGYFEYLLPLNDCSQIGNDEHRPSMFAYNIDADNGVFKIDLKTNNLITDKGEMNLLKANNVEIKSLEVDYGIYDKLLPENSNSQIGNKHNRTIIYGSTIDTNNLESTNGKIDELKSTIIISDTGKFNDIKTDYLCSDKITSINIENSDNIYSVNGKIDNLLSNDSKIDNLISENIDVQIVKLNKCNFDKLIPKNKQSIIGDVENKVNIVASNIISDEINVDLIKSKNIETDNIYSVSGKIENFKSKSIVSENSKFNVCIFNKLIPENSNCQIGDINHQINIIGSCIKTSNLNSNYITSVDIENSNNIYSLTGQIDCLNSDKIDSNYINSKYIECTSCKVDDLMPYNNNSKIGNEEFRINIYSNNLDTKNIKSDNINCNVINSSNIENIGNIYSVNSKLDNLISQHIISDNSYLKKLEFDTIVGKNGNSLIGLDTSRVNIYGDKVDIISLNAKFKKLLPECNNALIGIPDNRVNMYGNEIDISSLSASFNYLIPKCENSIIGNPDNRVNIFINKLDADIINGNFGKLIPLDDEAVIGDQFNRVNIYSNESNINSCRMKKFNGNFELLLPANEDAVIGDLANRTNIFAETIDANKCVIKRLEVIDELKVNKMESISTFHYGSLTFNEGKFNSLIPSNYDSNIGDCDNRFNLYTNKLDSNFGIFNENLETTYLKANNLNVKDNVCISHDYKNNDMLKTDTENSKLDITADFINISSVDDSIMISNDGIEIDGLLILSNITINTNSYANEYIYACKSLIFLTGNTGRNYILSNNKSNDNNTCELIKGTFIKIVNISNVNIVINGYILCNDADFYNFVYYNKWYCLNKGNKYVDIDSNTVNNNISNDIISCSSTNNISNDNDSESESESCVCNTDDITYENNCDE